MAYWYRNKLEMGENGGIINDEDYSSHSESDNSVINVNLSSATNFVVSSGIGFEHYFNLLSQKTKSKEKKAPIRINDSLTSIHSVNDSIPFDSLAPIPTFNDSISIDTLKMDSIKSAVNQEIVKETKVRKFTLGRICHSFWPHSARVSTKL